MAGGGMGRRRGPTLAERSRAARAAAGRQAAPDADAPGPGPDAVPAADPADPAAPRPGHAPDATPDATPDSGRPGPRRRHCWVVAGPGDGSGPWPGLVVEWHRDAEGWRARVVYLVGEPGSATTVETWVDAAHLRPAEPNRHNHR